MSLIKTKTAAAAIQIGLPVDADYQKIGLWEWNLPQNLIYADEIAARLFGVDETLAKNGLPPEHYLCRIHPSDRSFIEKQIETCIVALGVCSDEYRVRGADDEFNWLYTRGRCFGDREGRPTVYSGMAVNIGKPRLSPEPVASASPTTDPVGDILHICLNARSLSSLQHMGIVTYLLDMLILELNKGGEIGSRYLN